MGGQINNKGKIGMNELLKVCIERDGKLEGKETYDAIIEECNEAVMLDDMEAIENILHDNGFEPDYVMDVLEVLTGL